MTNDRSQMTNEAAPRLTPAGEFVICHLSFVMFPARNEGYCVSRLIDPNSSYQMVRLGSRLNLQHSFESHVEDFRRDLYDLTRSATLKVRSESEAGLCGSPISTALQHNQPILPSRFGAPECFRKQCESWLPGNESPRSAPRKNTDTSTSAAYDWRRSHERNLHCQGFTSTLCSPCASTIVT